MNDCSLTLVYAFVLLSVLVLWRPRKNNVRCACRRAFARGGAR